MLAELGQALLSPPRLPLSALVEERVAMGNIEIPMLPESAAQVARAAGDDRGDARKLVELVRRDQLLVGNLMQVANTSLYSTRVPAATIHQAVSRLGFSRVREVALAVACRGRLFRVPRFDDEVRSAFQHAYATACYAQEVARRQRSSAEEAFLVGLLHDSGEAVLLNAIAELEATQGIALEPDSVREVLALHHARVSAELFEKWSLPARLAMIVRDHHEPPPEGHAPLAHALRLAEALADHALGVQPDVEVVQQHPSVVALSLYGDEVDRLVALGENIKKTAEAIR